MNAIHRLVGMGETASSLSSSATSAPPPTRHDLITTKNWPLTLRVPLAAALLRALLDSNWRSCWPRPRR